jgi:WD40 repeat protein
MLPTLLKLECVVFFALFSLSACQAQSQSNCRPAPPLPAHPKPSVNGLTLSSDGKTLVVAGGDAKIRFVDLATGTVQRTFEGHTNAVYGTVFSPTEKLLVSSSRDTARIWDVLSGHELWKVEGFRCPAKAAIFSPDGHLLAVAGNDGIVKLYDVKSRKELRSMVHANAGSTDISVYALAFSSDSQSIYAANGDGTISEWGTSSGRETRTWKAHDHTTLKLAFSPDYTLLASFGDSVVKLWDTKTWREVRSLSMVREAQVAAVPSALAFSKGGKLIAASDIGIDQKQGTYSYVEVLVWSVDTGSKLFTIEGHKFDINGLVFTDDNRFLLTGSVDMTIKSWDMKTGQLFKTFMMPMNTN